jgi:transcriptional regulator with XRE-family HTH domain
MHHDKLIQRLKERREVLNLTQDALADLAGVGLRTIKQLESGQGNPTIITIQKIADTLGMEISLQVKKLNESK